jgi:hypothetical protein
MTTELKWGESPWDSLTRDELLREVQRMASALLSARSVMTICGPMAGQDIKPFWSSDGSGGRALERADIALRRHDEYGSENCYRAFFRTADWLLFPKPDGPRGSRGWMVCPTCGVMRMEDRYGLAPDTKCPKLDCGGAVLRPITWDDMKRKVPT